MAQDARRFIYSSDSETPYFVWKYENNVYNEGIIMGGCAKYQHNLPFTPILAGVWSSDPNFVEYYNLGEDRFAQGDGIGFVAIADSQYIYVHGKVYNNTPTTFYFKLFSYAPPDYEGDLTPLTDTSTFHFSTDNTYLQLAAQGRINSNGTRVFEISHSLGYIPLYKVWRTVEIDFWDNGMTQKKGLCPSVGFVDMTDNVPMQNVIDTTKLTVAWWEQRSPDASDYAYYHIYTNEA